MKPHCSRTVLIRLSLCLTLLACVSVCCLNFLSLRRQLDRKSTRLNSSHSQISYAVFCLKKNEVKPPPEPPATHPIVISDAEIELALQLIGALTTEFDPSTFRDRYRDALMTLIQAKYEGK